MTSLYLQCDDCATTLGMEAILKTPHWSKEREFIETAMAYGWIVGSSRMISGVDLCPACAAKRRLTSEPPSAQSPKPEAL